MRPAGHLPRRCSAVTVAALLAFWNLGTGVAQADPNTLWRIVHEQCVPDEQQNRDPAPCARVDLSSGEDGGFVVLKDIQGARQYLLIPTARITGIESPALLAPGETNYFAAAWQSRSFLEERAGGTLPRDWVSLAVNSSVSRSQDQLHIHVDCLRADVHETLSTHAAEIGSTWAPFPIPLAGHTYSAVAVTGADLAGVNPFTLLADGLEGARADMGLQTLVVVGATGTDGQPGFVILADRADGETGDFAGGEQLQDHDSCPPPLPPTGSTAK